MRFTPFPGEPVGCVDDRNRPVPELFMFSTDFPHPEGGRDPLRKFEEAMLDVTEPMSRERFFHDNMLGLLHGSSV